MVERGGLENRCARQRTEGSNPSPSATRLIQVIACKVNRKLSETCMYRWVYGLYHCFLMAYSEGAHGSYGRRWV